MDLSFLQTLPKRFDKLEGAVLQLLESTNSKEPKEVRFTMDEVIDYLPYPMAKSTLYEKLRTGEFPAHKNGKHWYFFKSEVDTFLRGGKRKTTQEIQSETDNLLSRQ